MIRVGIVGIGGIGTVHYNNYLRIAGCKVVAAVCHSVQSKEKARKLNLNPYDDISAMVKNENIDVIDICTPTYLHKEQVMESLYEGKHVIVEKPIALYKKDVEEMFALAKQKKRQLFVAHVVQFTKESDILQDIVKGGKYGKPLYGYFQRLAARPKWSKDGWLFDKNKSGLIPFDLHIHDLDLIISLFGKPKNFSYTSSGRKEANYSEAYRFQYEFDNFHVTAEAAWYHANYPFRVSWRVYLEKGLIEFDGEKVILYEPNKESTLFSLEEEVVVPTGINLPETGMFYNELSHFMTCVEKGVPSTKISQEQVITGVELLESLF